MLEDEYALMQVDFVGEISPGTGLDAREHFFVATVVAVGGHEQAAQSMVRARMVVPVKMRSESPLHLCEVVEAMAVEQLLGEVGVEHLDLAVVFFVLGDDLVDAHLGQQRREA
jgi:hypothetical protein